MKNVKYSKKSLGVAFVVAEIVLGVLLSSVSFVLFLLFAKAYSTYFLSVDNTIMQALYPLRTPLLTSIMFAISFLGNEGVIMLLVIFGVGLVLKRHIHEGVLLSLGFITGFFINLLLKETINRARPAVSPLYHENFSSFPSGHVMNSFVFSFLFLLILFRLGYLQKNKRLAALFIIFVILVGISRVYLGVHYPSDVVAGFLAGFCWVITVLVIEKTLLVFSLTHKKRQQLPH